MKPHHFYRSHQQTKCDFTFTAHNETSNTYKDSYLLLWKATGTVSPFICHIHKMF